MGRYLSVFILAVLVTFIWHGDAQAYVNPGKGSVLQQLLVGGLGGLVIVLKSAFRRVLAIFGKK